MSGLQSSMVPQGLTAADAPALTNVLKSKALERLEELELDNKPRATRAPLP